LGTGVAAVVRVECDGFIESNFSLMVRMEVSPLEITTDREKTF